MSNPQNFLITVARMSKCDEADLVMKWSAVVEEGNLDKITLSDAAKLTEIVDGDSLFTNLRPMTEDEINAYRKEQRATDDCD